MKSLPPSINSFNLWNNGVSFLILIFEAKLNRRELIGKVWREEWRLPTTYLNLLSR